MSVPIFTLASSRVPALTDSLQTYSNLTGLDADRSILHEDYFEPGIEELARSGPFKFGKYIETRPALGIGHAIHQFYKNMPPDEWVLHMEDDWLINLPIDLDRLLEVAKKSGSEQVFLSSKTNYSIQSRPPEELIGDCGFYTRRGNEKFGHLIPNTTPSLVQAKVFHPFVAVIDEYIEKGFSTKSIKFSEGFSKENPFHFVSTPRRFWKVWQESLVSLPRMGFLIGKDSPVISHQKGNEFRRLTRASLGGKRKPWRLKKK